MHGSFAGALCRAAGLLVAACACSLSAQAQWPPSYDYTAIHRLGLIGPDNTSPLGAQESFLSFFDAPDHAAGTSLRYTPSNTSNGQDAWIWNGISTIQVGLTGGVYTGSAGRQNSRLSFENPSGQVAGTSDRLFGVNFNLGRDAFVWNGSSTQQIGLTGGVYTGSTGYQFSTLRGQSTSGLVLGDSSRVTGESASNGSNTWIWNAGLTQQIGLTGGVHTGSAGREDGSAHISPAGQVYGHSLRYTGVNTSIGQDAWVLYSGATQQVGLSGPEYIGSAGYAHSEVLFQNDAGQAAGSSGRVTGVQNSNGQDVWVWSAGATTQLGFTGPDYTGADGFRLSFVRQQNAAGMVTGISMRLMKDSLISAGTDAWIWNAGTTQMLPGLAGPEHMVGKLTGDRDCYALNEAGQVVGGSGRFTKLGISNGTNTWVWNSGVTHQIGLTGGDHTGSDGYQYSEFRGQNEKGQVIGVSNRYLETQTGNGLDAWVWDGSQTTQVGLTGPENTGSNAWRFSQPISQNAAGQVVGMSGRFLNVNTSNGTDLWMWNASQGTHQIGLTGPGYTGTAGYRSSTAFFQNEAGQIVGTSDRVSSVHVGHGESAWYFDPSTLLTSEVVGSVSLDGNAYTLPTILTDEGFLLGSYTYFPGGAGNGDDRAFVYRPDLGFTDLGDLIAGGLTANGWATLRNPMFSDALRAVVGTGLAEGQTSGQSIFLAIPASPSLAFSLAPALLALRRKRPVAKNPS